jgi:hypothetical protein
MDFGMAAFIACATGMRQPAAAADTFKCLLDNSAPAPA